jgi:hypothetical protein
MRRIAQAGPRIQPLACRRGYSLDSPSGSIRLTQFHIARESHTAELDSPSRPRFKLPSIINAAVDCLTTSSAFANWLAGDSRLAAVNMAGICFRRGASTLTKPRKSILRNRGWQEPPADVLPTGHYLSAAYLRLPGAHE